MLPALFQKVKRKMEMRIMMVMTMIVIVVAIVMTYPMMVGVRKRMITVMRMRDVEVRAWIA
jgi:hypothetical protein